MKRLVSRRAALILTIGLALVVFWTVRVQYWSSVSEPLFSDMADFEHIALGVASNWDFRHDAFWESYRPPGVPLMRAAVMGVFGRDADLFAWRWVLGLFTFGGLCWMAYEIARATRRPWLGAAFLSTVALAKGSIFWSAKMSSEAPAEALLYYGIATSLLAARTRRASVFTLAGMVYAALLLTRPNFVALALVCPALLLALEWRSRTECRTMLTRVLALGLGLAVVWSPWLVRSYRLYGHVVPLTTHGPFAFFWELGTVRVDLGDGQVVTTNEDQLITHARVRFRSDYTAAVHAQELVTRWLTDNWRAFIPIVWERVRRGVTDRSEGLTQVSRTDLFPDWRNRLLIDKTPLAIVSGIAGLLLLSILFPPLTLVLVSCLGPWFFATLISGYGRYLDPMVPLLIAGNSAWVIAAAGAGVRIRRVLAAERPHTPPDRLVGRKSGAGFDSPTH